MANIRPRKDKNGNIISYEIRVFKGRDSNGKQLKPYTMTWKPSENMTVRQIEKELKRQEVQFEEQCKLGTAGDGKQTFERYADYVIGLKERSGVKHSVIFRYKELLRKINPAIGHLKLTDIRPQHLNVLYEQLSQKGERESGNNIGYPMNPDTATTWCRKFSDKYNLPHINPHAFRHTMATILYFKGVDSISISGRLGHAKPSTTSDMYSHIIKEADERSAETIADAFLR